MPEAPPAEAVVMRLGAIEWVKLSIAILVVSVPGVLMVVRTELIASGNRDQITKLQERDEKVAETLQNTAIAMERIAGQLEFNGRTTQRIESDIQDLKVRLAAVQAEQTTRATRIAAMDELGKRLDKVESDLSSRANIRWNKPDQDHYDEKIQAQLSEIRSRLATLEGSK